MGGVSSLSSARWHVIAGIFLAFIFVVSSAFAKIGSELAVTLRSSEKLVEEKCFGCRKLSLKVQEFPNGNTFVKFKENVAGEVVELYLPAELSATDLMEALMIVRTAQTNHASSVRVKFSTSDINLVTVRDSKGTVRLNLGRLFQVAGADSIQVSGREVQVLSSPRHRPPRASLGTFIYSPEKTNLAIRVHQQLGLEKAILENIPSHDLSFYNVIQFAQLGANSNESFVRSLAEATELASLGASVTYLSPYLPYARSDKVDQSGIAVGGRLAADLIEATGVASISFVRAHAPQSQGFFSLPTAQISGRPTINEFLKSQGVQIVEAPDAGALKDVTRHAIEMSIDVGDINKQRDPETQELRIFGVNGPSPKGKIVAIIDDETASGSTLASAAEALKKAGAVKVIAVVSHLNGDAGKAIKSPDIDVMVVTDTIPVPANLPSKVIVLSLANEVSDSLRQNLGKSLCARIMAKGGTTE